MKITRFLQIAALILIAAGAQPAYSALYQWSKTAATNATADATINWSEGQSPSSVNDSARAMMARVAEYRDDISGSITTGGSSTAYTLTTNQGITSVPTDGQMLAFRASATNGAAATMTVDVGTTYALQSPAGTALPSGTLVSGTPYRMQFNAANSAWVIEGITGNPYAVPLGGLLPYTGTTAPNSNFILPAGQCISTTTYATYWVLMGSPASGACAGGQFAVLDLRGRTLSALDNLNGTPANRLTNAATGCGTAMTSVGAVCANGAQSFNITLAQLPTGITSSNGAQSISFGGNIPLTGLGSNILQNNLTASGSLIVPTSTGGWSPISSVNASITVTSNNTNGVAHPNVMPVIGVGYLLRVI